MILADTSVWVAHMRHSEFELVENLASRKVLMHTLVIGELACGNLQDRTRQLAKWRRMPRIVHVDDDLVMALIESRSLMGRGITFIDAHLLCSALARQGTQLWTRDRRLRKIAEEFGVAFSEESRRNN